MKQPIVLPLLSEILVQVPAPRYDRRLSDKVLAAYAHAYEIGELAVAGQLRRALEEVERNAAAAHPERRTTNALRQADLLVEFVDARDVFKQLNESGADPKEVETASRDMLEAYRRWSDG